MKKFFLLMSIFLWAGVCRGGLTPGKYELQTLGGQRAGDVVVSLSSATFREAKAQRLEIITQIDGTDNKEGVKEEAWMNEKGLVYLERLTRGKDQDVHLQGERDSKNFVVRKKSGEDKSVFAVPLANFDISGYELDLSKSPFFKMDLGERKETRVFSVDEMAAVKAVRIVTEKKKMDFKGKEIDIFVVNTTIGGKVFHSWFEVKTHRLMYERSPERILRRLE